MYHSNLAEPNDYVNEITEEKISVYLTRVMGWMFFGLLITVIMSIATRYITPLVELIFGTSYGVWAVFVAQIAIVMALSAGLSKMQPTTATILFLLYSAVTGITLCTIYISYSLFSIAVALLTTSIIFLAMTIFGLLTKKDLTKLGSIAIFALFGVILSSVINLFLGSGTFDLIISAASVLVFVALTAYDAKKIKAIYCSAVQSGHETDGAVVHKLAIMGAFSLYLDFINLFLSLLRVLNRRK